MTSGIWGLGNFSALQLSIPFDPMQDTGVTICQPGHWHRSRDGCMRWEVNPPVSFSLSLLACPTLRRGRRCLSLQPHHDEHEHSLFVSDLWNPSSWGGQALLEHKLSSAGSGQGADLAPYWPGCSWATHFCCTLTAAPSSWKHKALRGSWNRPIEAGGAASWTNTSKAAALTVCVYGFFSPID